MLAIHNIEKEKRITVSIDANKYIFKANGQSLKFKGFMTLYVEGTDDKQEEEEKMLPELQIKQELKECRKSILLCSRIEDRSVQMKEKLKQEKTQERKQEKWR